MKPLEMNFVRKHQPGSSRQLQGISLREAATRVFSNCQRLAIHRM